MKLQKVLTVSLSCALCLNVCPVMNVLANDVQVLNVENDRETVSTINFTEGSRGSGVNQISFKGTWVYESGIPSEFEGDGFYYQNNTSLNRESGFDITFEGNKIEVYGIKENVNAIVKVEVDGVSKGTVDLYSAEKIHQQCIISIDGLEDGQHTLSVRLDGKNSDSRSYGAYVDFAKVYKKKGVKVSSYTLEEGKDFVLPFDGAASFSWDSNSDCVTVKDGVLHAVKEGHAIVTGQSGADKFTYEVEVVPAFKRSDESYDFIKLNDGNVGSGMNQFHFIGDWGRDTGINGLYERDGHWTAKKEQVHTCGYEFQFKGDKISIYGNLEPVLGIAEVYIDDDFMGYIDMYAPQREYQKLQFESPVLDGSKVHTLRVQMTGRKNPKATGVEGYVDFVEVVKKNTPIYATAVTLPEKVELEVGSEKELDVTFTPEDTNRKKMSWEVKDSKILDVVDGKLIAKKAGKTEVKLTVDGEDGSPIVSNVCMVTVKEGNKYFHGGYGSTNKTYFLNMYDELMDAESVMENTVTAWKDDRVYSEIVLLTKKDGFKNLKVEASDFVGKNGSIEKQFIQPSFLKYTLASGYGPAGNHGTMTPDIIFGNTMDVKANTVVPVWVEMNVPASTPAGTYSGKIVVKDDSGKELISYDQNIEVLDIVQPSVQEEGSYYLELWNYVQSSARYYGVELMSDEHLAILQPHLQQYRENAGKTVMATICEEPWNHQTYDDSPSMVKWTKKADGTFEFDYTLFDKYAQFVFDNDLAENISCYSIVPWENRIFYYDEVQKKQVEVRPHVGSEEWTNIWTQFLTSFTEHLDSKGWFNNVWMAMDERGRSDMQHAIDLINSVKNKDGESFKISGAFNQVIGDIWEQMYHVSPNIGSVLNYGADRFRALADERKEKGLITTMYTCTGNRPNMYNLYDPSEAAWTVWMGESLHTDGFMRWAYDSWVEDPLNDASHRLFETGDVQMVYPGDKEDLKHGKVPVTRSAPRTERLFEAIRDVQKLRYIKEQDPEMSGEIDAFIAGIRNFNGSGDTVAIGKEMDRVKKGVMDLTRSHLNGNKMDNINPDASLEDGQKEDTRLFVNDGNIRTSWNVDGGKATSAVFMFDHAKDLDRFRLYLGKNDDISKVTLNAIDVNGRTIPVKDWKEVSKLSNLEKQYQVVESSYLGLVKGFELKVKSGSNIQVHECMAFEKSAAADKSKMSISASSQETASEDGKAKNMIDGKDGSIWHSKYSGGIDQVPFTITLDLGEVMSLDKIDFLPRQSGENGIITKFDLKVAEKENEFENYVVDGSWARDHSVKTVDFNGEKVRYVQLVVKEAVGNFGSLAEITPYKLALSAEEYDLLRAENSVAKAEKTKDLNDVKDAEYLVGLLKDSKEKEALKDRLNALKPVKKADYSRVDAAIAKAESLDRTQYKDFSKVDAAIKAVVRDKDITEQEVVDGYADAIYKAMDALEEKEVAAVNKDALKETLAKKPAKEQSAYTPESWDAYQSALNNAQKVMDDAKASQKDVDKAVSALNDALAGLKEKETVVVVNKDALKEAIKGAEALKPSDYVQDGNWNKFQVALKSAKEVLADANASQKDVDQALKVLNFTKSNLKKAEDKKVDSNTALGLHAGLFATLMGSGALGVAILEVLKRKNKNRK